MCDECHLSGCARPGGPQTALTEKRNKISTFRKGVRMSEKQEHSRWLSILPFLQLAALVAPIVLYIHTFGSSISSSHSRWAEMGSAMAGIYSPMMAYLAYLFLAKQVQLQSQFSQYQIDLTLVQEARADMHFYLEQLDKLLTSELETEVTIRDFLLSNFEMADLTTLRTKDALAAAAKLHRAQPKIMGMWNATMPYFQGLKAPQMKTLFSHNLETSRLKAIAMLSRPTCIALDNYLWCLICITKTALEYEFQFSPLFEESTVSECGRKKC